MLYTDKNIGETYCAPFLGNGKLSLQITPDGAMNPNMRGSLSKPIRRRASGSPDAGA